MIGQCSSQQSFDDAMQLMQKTKTKTAKPTNETVSKLVVKRETPAQPRFVSLDINVVLYAEDTCYKIYNSMLDRLNRSLFKIILEKAAKKNYTVQYLQKKMVQENEMAINFAASMC